jgi:hypothetical protein
VTDDDDLSRLFHELPSPLQPRPGRAAAIVASVTTVVVLIVATFALLGSSPRSGVTPAAQTPAAGTSTTTARLAPTATTAPSSVSVSCWAKGPSIAMSQIKPGVYGTPVAAPLRAFLTQPGRFADLQLDQLPHEQWALVSHDAIHRVFAQRTPAGISAVLYFKLYLGSWRPDGQCTIRYGADTAVPVRQVAARGRTLDLNWDNGTCNPSAGGPISSLVRRVVVTETNTHVLISLITYQNPAEIAAQASQAAALPSGSTLACGGVGLKDHVKVTLKAPLGSRTLLDVSTAWPERIELTGTIGKPLT